MKVFKKAIFLIIAIVYIFTVCACGDGGDKSFALSAPYYNGSDKEMNMFAYSTPTDGTYMENGQTFYTQDNRTVERYKEYKDAGFNVLFLQANDPYRGEDFETSQLKKNMDNAKLAGIDKVIVCDLRIYNLCKKEPIVGEGCEFATQTELEDFIRNCLSSYNHHETFYGVMLLDEPTWEYFVSMGPLIKAIYSVAPDIYVQSNLRSGPHDVIKSGYSQNYANQTTIEAFTDYIDTFLTQSESRYLINDIYPFVHSRPDSENLFILSHYFQNMQISAEKAAEYGIEFHHVTGSTAMIAKGEMYMRYLDKPLVYYETNTALGFGVKSLAYFTYWRKQANDETVEWFPHDGAMINQDGTPTQLYYDIKDINAEIHAFAPVILNFDYQGANAYQGVPLDFPLPALGGLKSSQFTALKDVKVANGDAALVTELKDKDGNFMYMIQNVLDPANNIKGDTSLDFTATFDGFDYAAVYYKGKPEYVRLNNGKFSDKLAAGYADFIIPFNVK